MEFRFVGQYTNDQTTISACGITFVGHEPSEVTDEEAVRRLSKNPEFEAIEDTPNRAEQRPDEQNKATNAAQAVAVSKLTRRKADDDAEKESAAPKTPPKARKPRKAKK